MKKSKALFLLVFAVFFLSACSLTGSGSDGGVFRSDDGGKTFLPKIQVENKATIGGVDILSLAVNPQNGSEIYAGSKASGIFKTSDGGEIWKQLKVSVFTPTKVYSLVVDPGNPATVYAAAVIGKTGKILKSVDSGEKWREVYSEPTSGTLVLSLAVNPKDTQNIFAGTDKGQIILSADGGETWRSAYWLSNNNSVYKIDFDNFDGKTAYFVIFQGGVLRTTNKGESFEKLNREKNEDIFFFGNEIREAVSLKTDPGREGWLYIGTSEGLLRSKDRGESWEVVKTLNKPSELNIRSIAVNPQNSDEIVCTVAQAFYKSIDGGVNWLPVQFSTNRTLEAVEYNPQKPEQIFVGLNKR